MLQELKAVYFEAIAFSKNDLDFNKNSNANWFSKKITEKNNNTKNLASNMTGNQDEHLLSDRFDKNSCVLSA